MVVLGGVHVKNVRKVRLFNVKSLECQGRISLFSHKLLEKVCAIARVYGLNCGWNLVVCKVRLGSLTIVSCINICIVSEKSKTVSNATSMGYPVSQNLIKPDPERNKPMFECPAPWTDKAFKNALGLFSHYPIILGGSRISLGSFIL